MKGLDSSRRPFVPQGIRVGKINIHLQHHIVHRCDANRKRFTQKSLEERKVGSKSSRLKASGGKKESLRAAASFKEADLQKTYNIEEGERQW